MALSLRSGRPKLDTAHATPARAELALAIAEHDAATETLARMEGATGRGADAPSREAWRRVEEATAALEAAREAAGASLAAGVASGEVSHFPPRLADARAALAAAKDSLEAADAAEKRLADGLPSARDALRVADKRVHAAAAAVVREHPSVADIVARVEKMQRELLAVGGVLEWLVTANVLPRDDKNGFSLHTAEADIYENARFRMSFLDNWAFQTGPRTHYPHGVFPEERGVKLKQIATAPWRAALEALKHDADAALPELS